MREWPVAAPQLWLACTHSISGPSLAGLDFPTTLRWWVFSPHLEGNCSQAVAGGGGGGGGGECIIPLFSSAEHTGRLSQGWWAGTSPLRGD